MTQLVVVTGPDGAGKSSVCEIINERLDNCVVIDLWGGLRGSPFEASKADIHAYLQNIDPTSRGLLVSACLSRSLRRALTTKTRFVIVDGYWYKYAVTELALSGDSTMINIASTVFPVPDHVFFLDVNPAEALKRKLQFSRYEAGFSKEDDAQAFIGFQTRIYDKWQTMLSLNPCWHIIDTDEHSAAAIAGQIVRILANA